ncbi:MAG: recombination regulator RecX [Lachnospiraceae bacterium]|nr:recombination regulator RecX [Lachnospiraceae bacterium]
MNITAIEPYRKGKVLIYLNDEPSFVLYISDVKQYQLTEGMEFEEDLYKRILTEVLFKRAKTRTLHLLDKQDRTEKQLRFKLKENMYPPEAIDEAVEAAKRGHYLDDERYARIYIREKSRVKSRRVIEEELKAKGIAKDIIVTAMEDQDEGEDSDIILIEKLIKKKCHDISELDYAGTQKLMRYLSGKGFDIYDIRTVLERLT